MTEKKASLDGIDRAIVRALERDARLSYRDLGSQVGLSPNAAAERLRRLVTSGVIRGFHADADPDALGFRFVAYVDIKTGAHTGPDQLESIVADLPEVRRAVWTTGSYDFTLEVICRDQSDLVRVVEILRVRAHIQESNTRLICRELVCSRGNGVDPALTEPGH
jgi:Lrp/AsnC family leucine-responsive transcriptional regulator